MALFRSLALRGFVGLSLLLGGALLLVQARIFQEAPPGWELLVVGGVVWSALLAVLLYLARRASWPWPVPAAGLLLSLLLPIGWAHFDPAGHGVLGLVAPAVAILAGMGVLLRERWAWAPAFAIASGVGPFFLAIVPLPAPAYAAALGLFVADALALLALAGEFLSPPRFAA